MNACEMVKAAVEHKETGMAPYRIDWTFEAFNMYSSRIMARYSTPGIRHLLEKGVLDEYEALQLAIGNHVYSPSPTMPWWDWYEIPDEYFTSNEPPGYFPKTIGTGNYEATIEKIRICKELTGCYILVLYYGSHFEKANTCRGPENLYADIAANPGFLKGLLDYIVSKNLVMLENIIHIPEIDGILVGGDWGSQKTTIMSPEAWRELIMPGEKREYDMIKSGGKHVWIHSCGNIEALFPMLIEIGLQVVNPVQPECMDIYRLKRDFGDKLAFWGGISTQSTLPYGTPEDVKAETRRVVTEMSRGGGYIAAPAQHIQADVPYENICALIDTLKEFSN